MTEIFNVEKFDASWHDNSSMKEEWFKYVIFYTHLDRLKKVSLGDTIFINNPDRPPAFYEILHLKRNLNKPRESQLGIRAKHLYDAIGFYRPRHSHFGVEVDDTVMVNGKRHRVTKIEGRALTIVEI